MSIYCTREWIGRNYMPGEKQLGRVVSHPENRLARLDGDWPEGSIDTAHVPHWCVPGHEDHDLARWLRLPKSYANKPCDEETP